MASTRCYNCRQDLTTERKRRGYLLMRRGKPVCEACASVFSRAALYKAIVAQCGKGSVLESITGRMICDIADASEG